jgi:uncharacterized protein YecE (DUF72 family)
MAHQVRVGVGGWSFEAWDQTFYPPGLPKARQMAYMTRKMTAVEVNATYYSNFKPETFAKWRDDSPDSFVFSLKAHRFATVRKTREDMQKSIGLFLGQGITALKDKLGPINWQFPSHRKFTREYFDTFLSLLPKEKDKVRLRHALEVRASGFDTPEFFDLLTKYGATVVWADDGEFPKLRHEGADFAVTRMMRAQPSEPTGYTSADIAKFAKMYKDWSAGQDVYAFFISGAKERNPAAAMALQDKLGVTPSTASEADAMAAGARKKAAAKKTPAKKAPAGKTLARKK